MVAEYSIVVARTHIFVVLIAWRVMREVMRRGTAQFYFNNSKCRLRFLKTKGIKRRSKQINFKKKKIVCLVLFILKLKIYTDILYVNQYNKIVLNHDFESSCRLH
jgi:hypothetical protein